MEINTARLHPMIMIIISQQCACLQDSYVFFFLLLCISLFCRILFAVCVQLDASTLYSCLCRWLANFARFAFSLFRLFGDGNSIEATIRTCISRLGIVINRLSVHQSMQIFFKMSFFTLYKFCFYLFLPFVEYVCFDVGIVVVVVAVVASSHHQSAGSLLFRCQI